MNNDTDKRSHPSQQDEVITIHAMADPNCKRRGEASEAAFIARACSLNFPVAKLWGESDPIDILVGNPNSRQFWRVQVKCAEALHRSGRLRDPRRRRTASTPKTTSTSSPSTSSPTTSGTSSPSAAFLGRPLLYFYPHKLNSRGRYEKYREAWCLLACDPKARGREDIPASCRCRQLAVRCALCPQKSAQQRHI